MPTSVPGVEFRDAQGEMLVRQLGPQLLSVTAKGVGSEPMVHAYFREFHAFAASATRKIDVFLDWSAVTSYETAARRTYAAWGVERRELNRRLCRGVHVLVGSTLVFLALESSGGLSKAKYRHAYRDPKSFERELQLCLRTPATTLVERSADGVDS